MARPGIQYGAGRFSSRPDHWAARLGWVRDSSYGSGMSEPYRAGRPGLRSPPDRSPRDRAELPPVPRPNTTGWRTPWVWMKTWTFHPHVYPSMIREASPDARPGSLVQIYDREGREFGAGLWNPKARVPLRVLYHGADVFGEEDLTALVDRSLELRLELLRLSAHTEAFRAVHSDADGISGLVVDKFGDTLSVQLHSLGMAQRFPGWLPRLHERLGTHRCVVEVDPAIARMEGIDMRPLKSDPVRTVKFRENGLLYEVDFASGHKTGFFCDQRDNRRRLADFSKDKRVLDICCYTGGFAIAAKVLGGAKEVVGVDLDEGAIAQARRNANINGQARIEWVHCDGFSYLRQLRKNGEKWDVVVLDPPKLVFGRESEESWGEGLVKYEDLNSLGVVVTAPGGLLVTCSCSGQLSAEEFERAVTKAAHRVGRKLQFLDRTGAGADHPVMSNCSESRYLKVLWARVW